MSIFGRRNKRGPRTPEERERARREREARRAAREGRPAPVWDDEIETGALAASLADDDLWGGIDAAAPGADRHATLDPDGQATPADRPELSADGATGDTEPTMVHRPEPVAGAEAPDAGAAASRDGVREPFGDAVLGQHRGAHDAAGAARPHDGAGDAGPTLIHRSGTADGDGADAEATMVHPAAGERHGPAGDGAGARPPRPDAAGEDASPVWDDQLGEWVELPSEPPAARPLHGGADEPAGGGGEPAQADVDGRPAWDRTDAWEVPGTGRLDAWDVPEHDPPRPTLGEELRAVERGERGAWAAADGSSGEDDTQQATVEWDVLNDRPKQRPVATDRPRPRPVPPADVAGADQPTIEWDVLNDRPKGAVASGGAEADGVPGRPARGARRGGARGHSNTGARPRVAAARRPTRSRTLPPPPPRPGERAPRGGRRPRPGVVLALGAIVALLLVVAYGMNAVFQPFKGDGGAPVRVTIPPDSSLGEVGDVLERAGVVDSSFLFTLRARLAGASVQAGDYTLRADMPYGDAIAALEAGPEAEKTIRITIPEGRARRETRDLVVKAGIKGSYLEASKRAEGFDPRRYGAPRRVQSLEGFLFPATYELKEGATSKDLVARQLEAFRENIKKVDMRRARARNLTTYDVLIIASMIEREATLARERRLIAAVIYNRLRQGMPLGIDATIRYATRNWTRPLRQSELNIDSAYNTRLRTGLPPTPIGSPGLESIKAAANPANVDYLYYVVKPNGNGAHNFSSTIEEFERDVAAYNRERERRGGRSPADAEW
jgi:UPF0755 protein